MNDAQSSHESAPRQADDEVRYTVILPRATQMQLAAMAKEYKVSQGEVVDVLVRTAYYDRAAVDAKLKAVREAKVAARRPKKDLFDRFKNLTPEQLAAIEAMTAQQ